MDIPTAPIPKTAVSAGRRIDSLLLTPPALSAQTTCGEVYGLFSDQPALPAFAVLGDGGIGLVDRASFLLQFARPFGRELFERKPIATLMEADPLTVDAETRLAAVSHMIIEQKPSALHTGFVITRNGAYAGIATGLDLTRAVGEEMEEAMRKLAAAQDQLVQSEKFASLGQLVAGVAHEINTPIGVGLTAASHLRERTAAFEQAFAANQLKRSDLQTYVQTAGEAASLIMVNIERAADLIRSFKQVAVDQSSQQRSRFSLSRLVNDTVASLVSTLKKTRHHVVINCDDGGEMESYPGPISQIVTNLIMNAVIHAFDEEDAGTITLEAQGDQDTVRLVFIDDGKGIPPEHLSRIYEPFFTTRRGLGGSGLGLNVVHNIVTQTLMGRIECTSAPGRGTRFEMTLPRTVPSAEANPAGAAR